MSGLIDVYFYIPSFGMVDYEFLITVKEDRLDLSKIPKSWKYKDVWIRCVDHGSLKPKV